MNVPHSHRGAATAAFVLLTGAICRAGVPAGLGGLIWATETPQSNTLHGVAAPIPNAGGVGLVAVGDACTLLERRTPIGSGSSGWLGGRGREIKTNVQYRGVARLPSPARLAIASSDGSLLVGDSSTLTTIPVTAQGLNSVAWTLNGTGPRVALVGDSGSAYTYDDTTGKISPSSVDTAPGGPADLFALSFPGFGAVGYAAGDVPGPAGPKGALFRTSNGGQTWTYLGGTPIADAFLDVTFINPQQGYALGSLNGACIVAATQNNGLNWEIISTVDGSMRAIAAVDPLHIILAGGNGILAAIDGHSFVGRTEPIVGLTSPVALEDVAAAGNEVWSVGEAGVIFVSHDAGVSWESFSEVPALHQTALQSFLSLRYLSDKTVVVGGDKGGLLESQDGGASYSLIPGTGGEAVYALAAPGARSAGVGGFPSNVALAAGARRTITQIDSVAGTATTIGSIPNVDYYAVAAFGASSGTLAWAVGASGAIVFSPADSPVWVSQASGVASKLNALQCLSVSTTSFNLLAAGDAGVVLRSVDGIHWGPATTPGSLTPLPQPYTGTNLHGVYFGTAANGVVVGDAGVAAHTSDGGLSWTVQPPLTTAALLAVSALPPRSTAPEIWAVGEHQAVLRSIDAGTSWVLLAPPVLGNPGTPPPDFAYRAVQMVAYGTAFIAGDEGHLLLTVNDGETWTELGGTALDTYRALRMTSAATGVASYSSLLTGSQVAFTSDGWQSNATATLPPTTSLIYGVESLNGEAFAVGANGYLARSSTSPTTTVLDFASESSDIRAVVSPGAGQYVAAGDGALMMRSGDNGATWQRIPLSNTYGPELRIRAIAFGVPDTTGSAMGFAAGGVPGGGVAALFQSVDSGQTWTSVDIGLGTAEATINAISVFSNQALAAAANGFVYLYDGQHWTATRPIAGFSGSWNAVSATDGRWYLAGDSGMAARYPDVTGTAAWAPINTGTSLNLYSVSAPPYAVTPLNGAGGIESLRDDIRGYTGDPGCIMYTTSGGQAAYGSTTHTPPVTTLDVGTVFAIVAGMAMPTPEAYFYGDVAPPAPNAQSLPGDGVLDLRDVVTILRLIMGL